MLEIPLLASLLLDDLHDLILRRVERANLEVLVGRLVEMVEDRRDGSSDEVQVGCLRGLIARVDDGGGLGLEIISGKATSERL